MKLKIAFGALALTAALFSGCIFDSGDRNGSAKKDGTVSGTVKLTITGEPVANVKIYLVNRSAKIDTVNYTDNRAAFIDSAVTDSAGKYAIGGIAPGDYGIVPAVGDTASAYRFSLSAGPDSNVFSLNGETRTVDFIAEKRTYPGNDSDWFFYSIYVKKDDRYQFGDIYLERRLVVMYVPYWSERYEALKQTYVPGHPEADCCINCWWDQGYSMDGITLENAFRVTVVYYATGSDIERRKEFRFGFPLDHTPLRSYFLVDVAAGTIEQIEK